MHAFYNKNLCDAYNNISINIKVVLYPKFPIFAIF